VDEDALALKLFGDLSIGASDDHLVRAQTDDVRGGGSTTENLDGLEPCQAVLRYQTTAVDRPLWPQPQPTCFTPAQLA